MAKVYLAGPDVFHPDARDIFAAHIETCTRLGLKALVPVDDTMTTAREIFDHNVRLIETADGVIANIAPFRGPHCDVGTAWEIGYACARGKPVFAFSASLAPLIERIGNVGTDGRDRDGNLAENFGLVENLMIALSVVEQAIHGSFAEAAEAAARHFNARKPVARSAHA